MAVIEMTYFREHNHITFLMQGGRTAGPRDPAHHKETIEFVEENLLDLSAEQRHPAELTFAISAEHPSWAPDPDINFPVGRGRREVQIGAHAFAVVQEPREDPIGFGRALGYQLVAAATARQDFSPADRRTATPRPLSLRVRL